jgi:glycosyltransferase involved in cell wall biosynthesis
MADRHVLVVPLLSAGGMRVKIIEGMAMGRAIISTTRGAEGIDHTDGHDLLLADTPKTFAARILELIERPERIAELGANAHDLVKRKYSNGPIVQELVAFYRSLLKA